MDKNTTFCAVGIICFFISITGCSVQDKSEAIQVWTTKGETHKIIKLLNDPIQAFRIEAIDALVELQAREAIAPLGELFTDPDLIIVHKAVDAVVELGGPEIESYMLKAISLDTVPARISAATALGDFSSAEAVDALITALDDYRYEAIVLAAIESLGRTGAPAAVAPLTAKLQERSYRVRQTCIASLRQIGGEAALKGIATRLGDVNEAIRNDAVNALVGAGQGAVPFALKELRSENRIARVGALTVLNELAVVPEAGSDLVWFRLVELTAEENTVIEPEQAVVFDSIEDKLPSLLEGLVHPAQEIREYASIALENAGEAVVAESLALAEEKATEQGLAWFNTRSKWCGAPSLHLDLWGAVTALSPRFLAQPSDLELLSRGGQGAEKVMVAEQFRPRREVIPYLVLLLRDSESAEEEQAEQIDRCRTLAVQHLQAAGHKSIFPLLAGLNGSDHDIAQNSARVLNAMKSPRVDQMIVDEYFKQFEFGSSSVQEEEPEAESKPDPLDALSGTPLHAAIFEFDIPDLEPLRIRIRPTAASAILAFKKQHPDVAVINLPLNREAGNHANAVPVQLSYYKNDQMNDLNVIFRRSNDGIWTLSPPIPDHLP